MHLVLVVSRFLISAVMIGACLFGIRGRMGYNPIKVSQAYYCEDSFLNQLGINPAFNLLTSALDDMRKENKGCISCHTLRLLRIPVSGWAYGKGG